MIVDAFFIDENILVIVMVIEHSGNDLVIKKRSTTLCNLNFNEF